MNVIEAVMHMSLYAKAPHPVLVVDGVPLELWLKEADCSAVFGEDTVGGLVPAQGWLIDECDLKNAWYLLNPKNENSSTIVPIMICPDDMDMNCTVAVVEQLVDEEMVSWARIGRAIDVRNGIVVSVEWVAGNKRAVFDKTAFSAAVDELRRLTCLLYTSPSPRD